MWLTRCMTLDCWRLSAFQLYNRCYGSENSPQPLGIYEGRLPAGQQAQLCMGREQPHIFPSWHRSRHARLEV